MATGVYQIPFGQGKRQGANTEPRSRRHCWRLGSQRYPHAAIQPAAAGDPERRNAVVRHAAAEPDRRPGDFGTVYDRFNNWFNVAAFPQPAPDTFGTAPRFLNLRGPRLNTFDAALMKSWKVTERHRSSSALEASNLRNHPVFNPPARRSVRATSARSTARRSARVPSNSLSITPSDSPAVVGGGVRSAPLSHLLSWEFPHG